MCASCRAANRQSSAPKYTDPEALWEALGALNGKATHILRAKWVKTQRGGRLPKRGDKLPPEALITIKELREMSQATIKVNSECEPGTQERKVTVSGTPDQVQYAVSLIAHKLAQGP